MVHVRRLLCLAAIFYCFHFADVFVGVGSMVTDNSAQDNRTWNLRKGASLK